jgi:uncharacterized membrane protein YedE/YeeE
MGAAIFGVGWGLAGFCPGPALAAVVAGEPRVYAFVGAMIAGFLLFQALEAALRARSGSDRGGG